MFLKPHRFTKPLELIAIVLASLGIFFIPISAGMVNNIFPVVIICTLLAGNLTNKWQIIKSNRVVISAVALLFAFLLGIVYSTVPLNFSAYGFFKYTKLAYMLLLLPLFVSNGKRWQKIAENCFLLGVFINTIISLLNYFNIAIFGKLSPVGGYFIHPIYTSALLAFALFILLNRLLNNDKYKWIYGVFLTFGFYVLFFIYTERTGYFIAIALFALFLWQLFRWKGVLISLLALPILVLALFKFSPIFHNRIVEGVSNVIEYHEKEELTSIGYRMAFAKYSFKVIKEHPAFGAGTGSFALIYKASGGPMLTQGELLGHPHNEYILIMFQLGTFGLLLFLAWLLIQWRESFKLPLNQQRMAQGLIVAFVVNSFCNASLSINSTGMLYVVFACIYFAALHTKYLKE